MNKIDKAILSYAISENNKNFFNLKGGNPLFFFFMLSHSQEISNTVEKVVATDTSVLWNSNWLEGTATMAEVRETLDTVLATATADWKSPLDKDGKLNSDAYTDNVNNVNVDDVLAGQAFDFSSFSNIEKAFVSARITSKFVSTVDADKEAGLKMVPALVSVYEHIASPSINVYSIRNYIALERMINLGLDEMPAFDSILKSVNSNLTE